MLIMLIPRICQREFAPNKVIYVVKLILPNLYSVRDKEGEISLCTLSANLIGETLVLVSLKRYAD